MGSTASSPQKKRSEADVKSRLKANLDLEHVLYNKYAKGGARFASLRTYLYYYFKTLSWTVIIASSYLLKRLIDITGSAIALILFSPVFLITALSIKIEDPGPVFYSQIRVGKWGKLFSMYKFRSMVMDADELKEALKEKDESGGVIFKMRNDPRVTRVGRFIRKTSIDELPQLYNVLKGDMSLVGPRPPVPKEVDEYRYAERRRLDVIPGITCIWQVSGRSDINFKGQVKLDVQYIESQSLLTDLKILFKTIPAVIFGKGAY